MSSQSIKTINPIALRYLMTETIFSVDDGAISAAGGALTEPVEAKPVDQAELKTQFAFYGQNRRNYLFLTDEKQHEWMPEGAMDAFIKTLAALKLAEKDVALLNLARLAELPSVEQLTLFFEPKVVVNLGTPFVWPEQSGITVFHTHAFDDMLADAEKKRDFWTTIKRLFT